MFVNNYEHSETEKLTAIKYWSKMNEHVSIEIILKRLQNYPKMINLSQLKEKFVYFESVFFVKLRLNFQLIVLFLVLFCFLCYPDGIPDVAKCI